MRFRVRVLSAAVLLALAATLAVGETLPGFRLEQLAMTNGFATSVAFDSKGTLYYTTTTGDIFRLSGAASILVAHVPAEAVGNSGLLGMAMDGDNAAFVHYSTAGQMSEVIARVDLRTGAESVLHTFVSNPIRPSEGVSNEHHGGNLVIGSDGAIYFGIGDYFTPFMAPDPISVAGKIWRVRRDGSAEVVATGFRNPFGLAWDPSANRLIVADNGVAADDEINIVTMAGGFFGWPYTAGSQPQYGESVPPAYTFPVVVAPTGMTRLSGNNPVLRRGYVIGSFVERGLLYVPNVDARPFPDPIVLTQLELPPVVAVAEAPSGEIVFAAAGVLYRLATPLRGDCNGDGVLTWADLSALESELRDGNPEPMTAAQRGAYAGSWGCDTNGDDVISSLDRDALRTILTWRLRGVRRTR